MAPVSIYAYSVHIFIHLLSEGISYASSHFYMDYKDINIQWTDMVYGIWDLNLSSLYHEPGVQGVA